MWDVKGVQFGYSYFFSVYHELITSTFKSWTVHFSSHASFPIHTSKWYLTVNYTKPVKTGDIEPFLPSVFYFPSHIKLYWFYVLNIWRIWWLFLFQFRPISFLFKVLYSWTFLISSSQWSRVKVLKIIWIDFTVKCLSLM